MLIRISSKGLTHTYISIKSLKLKSEISIPRTIPFYVTQFKLCLHLTHDQLHHHEMILMKSGSIIYKGAPSFVIHKVGYKILFTLLTANLISISYNRHLKFALLFLQAMILTRSYCQFHYLGKVAGSNNDLGEFLCICCELLFCCALFLTHYDHEGFYQKKLSSFLHEDNLLLKIARIFDNIARNSSGIFWW